MAEGDGEILEEVLSCGGEEEEEVVHVIQEAGEARLQGGEAPAGRGRVDKVNSELVFWVPALLAVGREGQKLKVTQEEIQRRVSPPECLSQTMLLSLLRLSKEKGRELRQTLHTNGIEKLTSKSAIISSFTKLSEAEAAQLAEDYFYLASRHLRLQDIGRQVVGARGGWEAFRGQAGDIKEVLQDIVREVEVQDTPLTLMTHGFSPLILRAVVDIIIEILTFKDARGTT